MGTYRSILETFDEATLPDLDVAVRGALELCAEEQLPAFEVSQFGRPIVLGSVNAHTVAQLLFAEQAVAYGDEDTYKAVLNTHRDEADSVVVLSASGGKHAVAMAAAAQGTGLPVWLITNTAQAPAAAHVDPVQVLVFPKNREPYTYNTSTYLSMLLAQTKEDPVVIRRQVDAAQAALPDTLGQYDAFFCIIPPPWVPIRAMLATKFDELFGGRVSVRIFTLEEAKHAKTVVPSETECFLSFGEEQTLFGDPDVRVSVPVAGVLGYGAMVSVGYAVIGAIQRMHPPYFKEHIGAYAKEASTLFGQSINPVVS